MCDSIACACWQYSTFGVCPSVLVSGFDAVSCDCCCTVTVMFCSHEKRRSFALCPALPPFSCLPLLVSHCGSWAPDVSLRFCPAHCSSFIVCLLPACLPACLAPCLVRKTVKLLDCRFVLPPHDLDKRYAYVRARSPANLVCFSDLSTPDPTFSFCTPGSLQPFHFITSSIFGPFLLCRRRLVLAFGPSLIEPKASIVD